MEWGKGDMVSRGEYCTVLTNMSIYKWKGSGLKSHSLQLHEPMITAEGSQMWVVRVSVVTGLAVLTCNLCCKSLLHFQASLLW